ncbi:MAG: DUF6516 family protein [Desulfobacterales bacterium]|nr:DUF6516 family protein [Desulfobacterales bacterium]
MISEHYKRIKGNVERKFSDILKSADVDIWYSPDGSYSYHWEQRNIRDAIYRHDNASHKKWRNVSTFPKHCHNGSQLNVTESFLSDDSENAVEEFLRLVRERMVAEQIAAKKTDKTR